MELWEELARRVGDKHLEVKVFAGIKQILGVRAIRGRYLAKLRAEPTRTANFRLRGIFLQDLDLSLSLRIA
jgi:hypothetical protein